MMNVVMEVEQSAQRARLCLCAGLFTTVETSREAVFRGRFRDVQEQF